MIPELGHFALILAALLALVQGIVPLIGAARNDATLIGLARPVAAGQFFMVLFAFCFALGTCRRSAPRDARDG